ncbi:oligopeptide ABC transporter substrate-binding protein, partial [Heyndrickxia camelliae]
MKKKNHLFKFLSLIVVLGLLLSACGSKTGSNGSSGSSSNSKPKEDISKFPLAVKNDKSAVADGSLNYALVSDTPFEGTLNYAFYQGEPDAEVMQFFDEPLFATNGDYEFTNDGAASYE